MQKSWTIHPEYNEAMKMTKAIRIYNTGSPGVLSWGDYDPGTPGLGEVRILDRAVGMNFMDVLFQDGAVSYALITFHTRY